MTCGTAAHAKAEALLALHQEMRVCRRCLGAGYPIVAKVDCPDLHHRVELGAVVTGIADDAEFAA